jgi:hypothetical protein
MKSPNTKGPDELKREVHEDIRRVEKDIDAFQGRLTPGQLLDDAIFYRRDRNLGATFDHLKRNPIGTTFLSLGTLMLLEDDHHRSMEQVEQSKVANIKGIVQDSIKTAEETVRSQLPQKQLRTGDTANRADLARSKMNQLKEAVQAKVQDLREKLSAKEQLTGAAQEQISSQNLRSDEPEGRQSMIEEGREKISSLPRNGREAIHNLDPVTTVALGAGLGALTGIALPLSESEARFVSSKFAENFSNFNDDLQVAVKECSNILQDLVLQDVKDFNIDLFK